MYHLPMSSHLSRKPSSHSQHPTHPSLSTDISQPSVFPTDTVSASRPEPGPAEPAEPPSPARGGASQQLRMHSSGKPCHNCRRRRLRCDRSWPTCHKCAVTGQECQGYGKVFVWTQGIDENGKVKPSPPGRRPANNSSSSDSNPPTAPPSPNQAFSAFQAPPLSVSPQQTTSDPAATQHRFQQSLPWHPVSPALPSSPTGDTLPTDPASSSSTGALTDPLFQDLDRPSRYYLAYFADRVCQDLVARDEPGKNNPFRELLPLTQHHPLLLQVLIATSAIHWANIFRPITDIPTGLTNPGGYLAQLRSQDLVSRRALVDALTAKQKAMGHLREVLDTLDPAGSDVALAAMHFFIKFDLIDLDSQRGSDWKAHLEGAASIMALLTPETITPASSRMLRDSVIADCFIYHILGSTLSSGGLASRISRYAVQLLPVMKRVEVNSYLSCPPEILQIILLASQLSYERSSSTDLALPAADEALNLIDQALAFDINAWAADLQSIPDVSDIESRIHIASAHRSAACLYILQALPLIRSVRTVDPDFLVDDILSHLGAVGEDDPFFKAASWPNFIAGAETRDPEKRLWTLERLLSIWKRCRWGYIFTAIEMLKATWLLRDSSGTAEGNVNWLHGLKGMGFDQLVV